MELARPIFFEQIPLKILHPLHCLESKTVNLMTLPQDAGERQDLKHLRLSIAILRQYLTELTVNRYKLFLVELGLPLIQECDDFIKFGRLTEKHLLHLLEVLSQRFHSVLWRRDSQRALGRFAILRPRGFEKQTFVLGDSLQQVQFDACCF